MGTLPGDLAALVFDRFGGAEGDRRWAVLDARGEITWQGAHPRLALVRPRLEGPTLWLHAEGHAPLAVREEGLLPCEFQRWSEARHSLVRHGGRDAGPAAARWLSELAGAPLRLVRLDDEAVGRADAERLHLVTLETAREIDLALQARGAPPADVLRYRPNLVLAGDGAPLLPFIEEQVATLTWPEGGRLAVGARCVRCLVTDVDPRTGERGEHVLPAIGALAAQRFPGEPASLGMYARAETGTRLARGQRVALTLAF